MIELVGVRFGYRRGQHVLDGLDLALEPGLTLVVGPNGCGKTTLLKLAAGVERPWAGRVMIDGHDLWRDEVAARSRLAYVPEHPDLSPYATVRETLALVAGLRGVSRSEVDSALAWVGLETVAGRTVRELSKGQRRRAVMAAVRIGTPDVLVLDEPFEGLDLGFRGELLGWLGRRHRDGATLVVVSHELTGLSELADRAVTVRDGRPAVAEPLPPPGRGRTLALESLARGESPGLEAGRSVDPTTSRT